MNRAYWAKQRAGITLVEMLIAAALTMFILMLFAMIMQTATQGVRDAKGINAVDQKLRNAITVIKTDLRQVYLENNGAPFSPAELFTRPDRIPTGGFVVLEENDRALHQGLDSQGIPIKHDHDDVFGATIKRRGDSAAEMFFGRAAPGYSTCTVNGVAVDVSSYLDSLWQNPTARHDIAGNQQVSSQFAEVWYFCRGKGETPTLADVNADPWVLGNQGSVATADGAVRNLSRQPRTFKLYRRQLLVLNDESLNRRAILGQGVGPVAVNNAASIYNFLDVSVTRQLEVDNNGNLILEALGGNSVVHFNTLADLSRREFRYGMQPVVAALPQPFNAQPYFNLADPNAYNRQRTLRAYPLSHIDSTAGNSNPIPAIHDYYRARDPNERNVAITPTTTGASKLEPFIGRPTLSESAHPAYQFWLPLGADNTGTPVDLTIDPTNGELAAYPVTAGQRSGEDILLDDVLSVDWSVLEDITGYLGDANDGSNDQVAIQGGSSIDEAQFHDLTTGGGLYGSPGVVNSDSNTAFGAPTLNRVMTRRSLFVDLGYGADLVDYNILSGGLDTNPAGVNVLILNNYLFGLPPGPTPPQNFTLNGVNYTYTAPGYSVLTLTLTQTPFSFVPVPTTPQKLVFGANNSLLFNAFSPKGAPFGVVLDARHQKGHDVSDTNRNSDVVFGPDGKLGIAGKQDTTLIGSPDVDFRDFPTGEFRAPRSDDLDENQFRTIMAAKPGITGPDLALGERGNNDDRIPPGTNATVDTPAKIVPPETEPVYFSELFAPGTDDNPFVGVPFMLSGQVAANVNTLGGPKFHPFNLFNLNPRNTYDSWSAAPNYNSPTTGINILPSYKASPVLQFQVYGLNPATPTPPSSAVEKSYIPEPDFRPVPYARPLKGVQVKIRVLERRTGIVREATIRHYFGPNAN